MPICVGNATKIVDYIMNNNKTYKTVLKLGVETDTYDREGVVVKESNTIPDKENISKVIKSFIGEIDQIPPMYSALKVNGKKLYELARQGIEIERKPRKITINNISIEEIKYPYITFTVNCSKGTYIRSLCHDIGLKLGTFGTMWELERLSSGNFKYEGSVKLEELTPENISNHLISIEEALNFYEKIILPYKYSKMILNGVQIKDKSITENLKENINYRVYIEDKFIGIGTMKESQIKMLKLLNVLKV